ncbi:MAG: peptide-methionine (S)-S-oxide reductase [Enterocloster clostridioformis]
MIMQNIYFAGGCFWGVEEYFSRIPGVCDTECGYANGTRSNPTYEEVCSDTTGFAETVRIMLQSGHCCTAHTGQTVFQNHRPCQRKPAGKRPRKSVPDRHLLYQ